VPIGILGFILVTTFIDNIREEQVPRLDLLGFLLTGFGLAGLVFGFEMVGRGILPVAVVIAILAGGALCTTMYVIHSRRIKNPIIDLKLIDISTFATATVGGGLFRMGIGALPFLLPMLLQLVFGLSPFESGMLTFTSAAGALFMKVTAVPVIRRFGFRNVLISNGIIASFVLMSYSLFRPTTPHFVIIMALLSGGFLRSLQFTALGTLAYADVPPPLMSNASSLSSMAQQLSLSFGVAIAALLLHLSLAGRPATALTSHDFMVPFVTVGILGVLSSLFFISLHPDAGEEVSGRRAEVTMSNVTAEPAAGVD